MIILLPIHFNNISNLICFNLMHTLYHSHPLHRLFLYPIIIN